MTPLSNLLGRLLLLVSLGASAAQAEPATERDRPPGAGALDVADLELEDLLRGEVVVTASKREQRASASLSSVHVITREEIDASPYLFLGDLLAQVPGLDVRWGKMERLYVGARGLGGTAMSSRMLLLWDGLSTNDPLTGDINVGHFVPLVDVERVEIIRGAGSTMYGSNAFSGVINIITRGGRQSLSEPTRSQASALYGSFGTARLQASHEQNVGPVRVGASVEALRSDGPLPVVERYRGSGVERIKNDDVADVSLGLRAVLRELRLNANYTVGERGRPGGFRTDAEGNVLDCKSCHAQGSSSGRGLKYPHSANSCGTCHTTPHDREGIDRGWVTLSYEHAASERVKVSARAFHSEWRTHYRVYPETEFLAPSELERVEIAQRSTGAELSATHTWQDWNTMQAGVDVRRQEVRSDILDVNGLTQATEWRAAAYVEDELRPWSFLSATAGARAEWSDFFGWSISPRGGLVLSGPEGLSVRASVARAFRDPSMSERYVQGRMRYMVAGNPELRPEWMTSGELGVLYARPLIHDAVGRLTATGFANHAEDLIGFQAQPDGQSTFYNIGDVWVAGGELELELELKAPRLKAFAAYSHQRQLGNRSVQLPYAPLSKGNVGLEGSVDRLTYLVRLRTVSSRLDDSDVRLPAYAVLDASLGLSLDHGLALQLWGTNLSDVEYQPSLGTLGARRALFLSLRWSL